MDNANVDVIAPRCVQNWIGGSKVEARGINNGVPTHVAKKIWIGKWSPFKAKV